MLFLPPHPDPLPQGEREKKQTLCLKGSGRKDFHMHLQGYYDATQDRIFLRLWDEASGETAVWLTRRQWLGIALACYRARSVIMQQGGYPVRSAKDTAAAGKEQMARHGADRKEALKSPLVSTVKFRRIPFGLRIEIGTEGSTPLALTLKGENLFSFIGLVEDLAARAKWDLPAALSRMSESPPPKKQLLH